MRIGVVYELVPPEYGGARTLQESLVEAFGNLESEHEIVLLNMAKDDVELLRPLRNRCIHVASRYAAPAAGKPAHPSLAQRVRHRVGAGLRRAGLHWLPASAAASRGLTAAAPSRPPQTALERAAEEFGLHVMWRPDAWLGPTAVPYCITVWDIDFRLQPFFPEFVPNGMSWEQREAHHACTLPRATRVFTGTEVGKQQIIRFYGVNPANVVVNPYPVPRFIEDAPQRDAGAASLHRLGLAPGFLFYPAAFWPHKNHINLLLGLQILRDAHGLAPQLAFTGADAGNVAHVRSAVERLGLANQVCFLGFLPRDEIVELYRHAAALVYPTFVGPDNLPPLEAFASCCPVVASDIAGSREQLGDAALYFDPTRPEDIASAVARLLSDADLRHSLIAKGTALAGARSCENYVRSVVQSIEAFEPYRRTWDTGYRLTL